MTRPGPDPTLRLDLYLQALSQLRAGADPLVSVILFGSTAQGTFVAETSDVDLFVVLPDSARPAFKALFSFVNATVMSAVGFLLLPDATKYAIGVLKHSLHSCYFCYHLKTAPLPKEIEFFQSRLGPCRILQDLLAQRENYHRSFSFVLRCAPTLLRLHLRTARENQFPRAVRL